MVLPPINLNLDAKTVGILCGVILVCGSLLSFGYQLGNKDPLVICDPYIKELAVSKAQIATSEIEVSKKLETASLECVAREKTSCSRLVKQTTENLKRLRCKICEAAESPRSPRRSRSRR